MTIPCPRCQTQVPAEAGFCPRCGLPRAQFAPAAPAPAAPYAAPAPPSAPAAPFGPQSVGPAAPAMGAGPQAVSPSLPSAPATPQVSGPPAGAQGWPSAGAPPQQVGWSGPPPQQAGWNAAPPQPQGAVQSGPPFGLVAGQLQSGGQQSKPRRKRAIWIIAAVVAILVLVGAGLGYFFYRSTAPTSYVIATDRGKGEIDRIDITTRAVTVLIKSDQLRNSPDSIVFLSDTLVLIDFVGGGDLGLGDIAAHSYTSVSQNHGQLRDMAALPDGSGALVSEQDTGTILKFRLSDRSLTTLVQADFLRGMQGLAFDSDGNLYAAVGGTVYQLDPGNGQQLKKFNAPGGSDGMAYDKSRSALDIAAGNKILALDPKTGKVSTVIEGVGDADGVAIDRRGNLFIASNLSLIHI